MAMVRVWYGVIAAFVGAFTTAICTWLLYLKDGGNEAFYTAIPASIVAVLSGIGIAVHFVFPHEEGVHGEPSTTNAKQAIKRMKCRFCGGTGRYVIRMGNLTDHSPCVVCGGHGDFLTPLWSQPDCTYCKGSGGLVTRIGNTSLQDTCHICGGRGKRPLET